MKKNEKIETHESYGLVSFHRVYGHSGFMFGSDVLSENFIELRIARGEKIYDESLGFHYYPTDDLITVKMTNTQFAELLTNMNVGCGVPCTIEDINGKAVEQQTEIPDPLLQEFKKTFMGRSKDILNSLNKTKDELCSLIDKKNLTKKDQERMKSLLSRYITEIRCNMPFFINQYKEETANVVQRARAEIDAALQGSVIRAGIKALGIQPNITPIKVKKEQENTDDFEPLPF